MECQYCKKVLCNSSALKQHQTKTKYCLEIQGKTNDEHSCICGKKFVRKHHLNSHQETCQIVNTPLYQEIKIANASLTEENKVLKKQLEEALRREQELREDYAQLAAISAKRSTTTNNTVNNLNLGVFDKTESDINSIVNEKYDRQYLIQGQKGVAKFTSQHLLKTTKDKPPIYLITDRSRGNGKYKTSKNEIVTDTGMNGLTKKIYPSIKKKAIFITVSHPNPLEDEELMAGYHDVYEMDENNTVFRINLVKELELENS